MESNNKYQGNSGSSLTADLFGAKDKESPPKSSTGIFASIFAPPSQVVGRNSSSSELTEYWQKQSSLGNHAWNSKQAISGEGAHYSLPNKDRSSVLQEERAEPCHLSSSIYYGGQEVYSQSPSTRSSGSYPIVSLESSRKMGQKMIQMEPTRTVLPEEIGGKVRSIIRTLPSLAI